MMKKSVIMAFAVVVGAIASISAFAADYSYTWVVADTNSVGTFTRLDGKVSYTITQEGPTNCVKAMKINIAKGDTLTFSGITLIGAKNNNGFYFTNTTASTVIFNNSVTFLGNFRPFCTAPAADKSQSWIGWYDKGIDECFLGDTYRTVVKANADVKDWTISTDSHYVNGFVSNRTTHVAASITNCFNRSNTFYMRQAKRQADGSVNFQFISASMTDDNGKAVTNYYRKAITGRLYQDGADICAKLTGAYVLYGDTKSQLDGITDVDDVIATGLVRANEREGYGYRVNALRTNTNRSGGYGLNVLKIVRAYPCSVVRFNGNASMASGSHYANVDVAVELMSGASGKCGSWFGTQPSLSSYRSGVVNVRDLTTILRSSSIMGGGGGQLWFENATDDRDYTGGLSNACKFVKGAELVVKGGENYKQVLDIWHPCAFPTNGTVRIKKNGDMRLRVAYQRGDQHTSTPGSSGISGWMNYKYGESTHGLKPTVIVEAGGQLTQYEQYPFSVYDKITLDGGLLYLGAKQGNTSTDTGTYLYGGVTLKNGARIYPKYPQLKNRVGNIDGTSLFTVCGSSPSTNEVIFQLMGRKTARSTVKFDVWKTGDFDADFVNTAGFEKYPQDDDPTAYTNVVVMKTGNGRMLVKTGYTVPGILQVEDGVFAVEEGWSTDAYVILNGGAFEVGDDTELSRFNVYSAGGTLKLDEGAQVTIGELSAISGVLNIEKTNYADGDVTFLTPLTDAQIAKLRINGGSAVGVDEYGMVYATGLVGGGTKENPYLITGLPSLKSFRDRVDGTNTYTSADAIAFNGYYFRQTTDIDMADDVDEETHDQRNWLSIGTASPWHPFGGNYDGGGHKILNLKVVGSTSGSSAFFGLVRSNITTNAITAAGLDYLDAVWKDGEFDETAVSGDRYRAHVSNLTIESADVSGETALIQHIAPLISRADCAYVENCHVLNSRVTGSVYTGGLVGHLEGSLIKDCTVDGDTVITTTDPDGLSQNTVGGLIGGCGLMYSTNWVFGVINCNSSATISGTAGNSTYVGSIGGLMGYGNGRGFIYASSFNGSILFSDAVKAYVAGIAGRINTSSVICCTNNADIGIIGVDTEGDASANNSLIAGIVGHGCGNYVINCINRGSLFGDNNLMIVGGIYGRPHSDGNATRADHKYVYIVNSHNEGTVEVSTEGAVSSQVVGYWSNVEPTFVDYEFIDAGEILSMYPETFYSAYRYPTFLNCTVTDSTVPYALPFGKRVVFAYDRAGEFSLPAFDVDASGYVKIDIRDPGVKLSIADVSEQTWGAAPVITAYAGGDTEQPIALVESGEGVEATLNFAGISGEQKAALRVNGRKVVVTSDGDVIYPSVTAKGAVLLFY